LTVEAGFPNYDTLADTYGSWNAFPYSKGSPVTIGGGHKGEIWSLNSNQIGDNPQMIRNITFSGNTITVTTDWNNYNVGDNIVFEEVEGMVEINDKQAPIKFITTDYTTFQVDMPFPIVNAYTGGGKTSKTIPFEFKTKQLNPFAELDKKIRIGWIYFYVECVGTHLTDTSGNPVPAFLIVDVYTNDNTNNPSSPAFTYQVDCSNSPFETGSKKWVKIWINQTARFLQFGIRNNQAGAQVKIHAMMPGMQPLGRLI